MWWGTGRARFVLPGTSVTKGQTSRGQGYIPGRGNRMCAGKKEKCGVLWCRNITGGDCQRGCQRVQGWCFCPASCSGLSSCSSLQAPCPYSVPGVGPECGIEAGGWVREKDFVISCRHKDLCGWCYSGGEEEAAGKSCQRRIMGELEALPILVIPGHVDFLTVGKGSLRVCVGSFSFFCPCSWGSGDLTCLALVLALGGLPGKPWASSGDVPRREESG